MRGRWLPSLSVASPFTLHCYTFCIIERFPFIIHKFSPPLSFPLFYLAFHRFVETDLFLHLHGLVLHPSIYYWQESRRPSGLRKTTITLNSLAHRTTWLRSDFPSFFFPFLLSLPQICRNRLILTFAWLSPPSKHILLAGKSEAKRS